ncbi:HDIG domain-containing protein [Heliorestis acidaminivorans]|uniref:HDIG domain-containing protein n=1 Tax=Heliorestis acidaminivorans TaxID=553427 RepID=A0A6I0F1J8_9FIRM|nr:HDIG domain-containing metalloprotein [Heliorestis acidaminivorans]KAB2952281.1 HDIG domain-containing protein [Heliorestis acidaminivorans]
MGLRRIGTLLKIAIAKAWQYPLTRRITMGLLFIMAITAIMSFDYLSDLETLEVGQVSAKDIKAPASRDIIDEEKTSIAREQKVRATPPVYTHDPNIVVRVKSDIDQFFTTLINWRQTEQDGLGEGAVLNDETPGERMDRLKAQLQIAVPENILLKLLAISPELLAFTQIETENLIAEMLSMPGLTEELNRLSEGMPPNRAAGRVLPYNMEEANNLVQERIENANLSTEIKDILSGTVPLFLRPNAFLDVEATKRLHNEVRQTVAPVTFPVRQDQMILRAGDVVTEEHIEILSQFGLLRTGDIWLQSAGMALLVSLNMALLVYFLRSYRRDLLKDERMLWLLGLMITLSLITAKAIASVQLHEQPDVMSQLLYVIPAATGPMLLALLLDGRIAIFASIVTSLFIGLMTDYSITHAIVAFLGSLVGIYSVSRFSERMDFARAGINVAIVNSIAILALGLSTNSNFAVVAAYGIPAGLVSGILSSVFMIGSLPYLESAFKITTSVKLLELANPNHKLLRKLLMEAPGTYHHSLLVGNLGEAAAEAIGADPLLVRAGAYYHDIGKIKRPPFFIENQNQGQNPHDKIAPSLSTLIITSHVKDGVDLCREAGLPSTVVDIVEQHHGDTLVSFFYHRAVESDRTESIQEQDFRYEGPKPQTKEAALVLLADTVEAAVRALPQPTSGKIEGLVRKLIKDKLNDGQLEESDLTFKDLDLVAQSFCRVLNGIYHTRIEYPDSVSKE